MNHQHLVAVIQSIIIAHAVWRGSLDAFADITLKAMGGDFSQADLDEIRRLLRGPQLRTALAARDCALWVGADGLVRFVDLQPVSLSEARVKLQHQPGPNSCRYCLMTESPKLPELVQEKDHNGHHVAGSFTHEQCATAWRRLRMQEANSHE